MRKICILILFCWLFVAGFSQIPVQQSITAINKYAISPAFAGLNSNAEGFIASANFLTGISGAPKLKTIDANFPFGKIMSGGVNTNVLSVGNFSNFKASGTLAAHFLLSQKAILAFALSPNFYRRQIEISKIKSQGTDPVLLNSNALIYNAFGAGASVLFLYNNFTTGIVFPDFFKQGLFYSDRVLVAHLGYFYQINKSLSIEPLVIAQTFNLQVRATLWRTSALVRYKERIWSGFSVASNQSFGFAAGCAVTDNIILNYEYRTSSNSLVKTSGGSHEICIGFLIRRGLKQDFLTLFPKAYANELLEINKEETESLREELRQMRKITNRNLNNHENRIKELEQKLQKLKENQEAAVGNLGNIVAPELWNDPVILQNIKFGNNSDKLFSSSFAELNKVVNFMVKNPMRKIKIIGYTDNIGSVRYNKYLSTQRALAVKSYLVRRGINPDRVYSNGRGSEKPIGNNNSQEGRAKNRRIEVEYQKK